jgi:mRNA-degrading endonuclease toxin of MazEF toxin-antitoxin module
MIRGKVVLVPFPFDDLSAAKVRPAVCLTNAIGSHRHVVLAFISSQIPQDLLETDVVLHARHANFATMGLHVSSTLRLHRLITVATSMIQRELGSLPNTIQSEVNRKLRKLFELRGA